MQPELPALLQENTKISTNDVYRPTVLRNREIKYDTKNCVEFIHVLNASLSTHCSDNLFKLTYLQCSVLRGFIIRNFNTALYNIMSFIYFIYAYQRDCMKCHIYFGQVITIIIIGVFVCFSMAGLFSKMKFC